MLEAVFARHWNEAVERAESLLHWMRSGGVPPQTATLKMRRHWNRFMAEFGCLLALQLAREARRRHDQRG